MKLKKFAAPLLSCISYIGVPSLEAQPSISIDKTQNTSRTVIFRLLNSEEQPLKGIKVKVRQSKNNPSKIFFDGATSGPLYSNDNGEILVPRPELKPGTQHIIQVATNEYEYYGQISFDYSYKRNEIHCIRMKRINFENWEPRFINWSDLSSHYKPLKKVLSESDQLHLRIKNQKKLIPLGAFCGTTYDNITSKDIIEGKAGLLNMYARMQGTKVVPGEKGYYWWNGVKKLLVIQRDRIVGIISECMAKEIQHIYQNSNDMDYYNAEKPTVDIMHFQGRIFSWLSQVPILKHISFLKNGHIKNIEAGFKVISKGKYKRISPLFSIKTTNKKGVLQLTIGKYRHLPGKKEYWILDADIDENAAPLHHFRDGVEHLITGKASHPFQIYDIIHFRPWMEEAVINQPEEKIMRYKEEAEKVSCLLRDGYCLVSPALDKL